MEKKLRRLSFWLFCTATLECSAFAADRQATFRTAANARYLVAINGGGADLRADRSSASAWETFTIIDKNGGELVSGDKVHLKAFNGQYLQVSNGTSTGINAASWNAGFWESFIIHKQGGGIIQNGAQIGFQSESNGRFLSALNGGGSTVSVAGGKLDGWESFVLASPSSSPPPSSPPPSSGAWRLVWSDEFNGPGLDYGKWAPEEKNPGWTNEEWQSYNNRWENLRVENGQLVIEARRDYHKGFEYSSARIRSRASWKHGRIEARIRLPWGRGTWAAFWMLPDDFSRGWPACGEIDILEHVGHNANQVHASTHSKKYNWKNGNQKTGIARNTGAVDGFHLYAVEWYPDRIEVSIDGRGYFQSWNEWSGDDAWPFGKNFHLILNLAVGGVWGDDAGVDPKVWPQRMLVDYVRVYQK